MGLSRTPANKTFFEGENGQISVDDYFRRKSTVLIM